MKQLSCWQLGSKLHTTAFNKVRHKMAVVVRANAWSLRFHDSKWPTTSLFRHEIAGARPVSIYVMHG